MLDYGDITKHLMTGFEENSEICLPKTLNISRGVSVLKKSMIFTQLEVGDVQPGKTRTERAKAIGRLCNFGGEWRRLLSIVG